MTTRDEVEVRIAVPPPGGAGCFTLLATIALLFAGLAVYNLIDRSGLTTLGVLASAGWLVIVAMVIAVNLADVVSLVGVFARRSFIEIRKPPLAPPVLRYGFEWLGREFCYRPIDIPGITKVSWSSGQASHMSGRDCDDWSVGVWYAREEVAERRGQRNERDDLCLVSPPLPRDQADGIGRSLVKLLEDVGVRFVPNGKEYEYVVECPSPALP